MRTDYDRIAERYDEHRRDRNYEPNGLIRELINERRTDIAALDLGCGPGRWLASQMAHFKGRKIRWVGLDPFKKMVEIAGRNAPGAELIEGKAEAMPFPDASFDYVHSQVSFHHFEDKQKALDEIVRVLRPGGVFAMGNLEIWQMANWWPYEFFPETRQIDEEWFWPAERIAEALKRRGLAVEYSVNVSKAGVAAENMLAEAESRTLSQLASLADDAYDRGMRRLRAFAAKDPVRQHMSDFAWLNLVATKGI